jgi:hypothetical protein
MDEHDSEASEVEEPLVDDDGVDLTLVRYTLSLTPTERLKGLENYLNAMATVRPARRPLPDSP